MKKSLSALPLGGVGEVTMAMMAYECNGEIILVDCGLTFPDDATAPGTELILPDIDYVRKNRKRIQGIIITHGHEDHMGALPYLWEEIGAPVYLTKFARLILEDKLKAVGLDGEVPLHEVQPAERFKIGKFFDIEYINVAHSIPETNAIAIRTPEGNLFHSTEYKFDAAPTLGNKTDVARLKAFGDEGVLAMFGDSTNILLEGNSGSEGDLHKSLDQTVAGCKNRVFFCCFASHVARLITALEVAKSNNRKVTIWGYTLKKMLKYAQKCGYVPSVLTDNIISPEEAMKLPKSEVMAIITGSQAQPNAALYKLIRDQIGLKFTKGDTVILSANTIPGNEVPIYAMLDKLAQQEIEVIRKGMAFVHISGHGYQDEIAEMYKLIRPQIAVPMYGDFVQLHAHAAFAKKAGVPKQYVIQNGTRLTFTPEISITREESASFGRMYVDGLNILDEDKFILKERRQMANEGTVFVSFSLDVENGELTDEPSVKTRGLLDAALQPDLLAEAVSIAKSTALEAFSSRGIDIPFIEEAVRVAVRRVFKTERGKSPITIVSMHSC